MLMRKKIAVVMPAYNAEKTLVDTYATLPKDFVDIIILVDDGSEDSTAMVARSLGVHTVVHKKNMGYGANQKTCYTEALRQEADIVVMLHPDYQYDPRLVGALVMMIASGVYDAALGSRILGNTALSGGMPLYKYIANRFLTAVQNKILGAKLSEFHTGFRAFSREILTELPLEANSDDFAFDNEMLMQIIALKYRIGEISCPTKYFGEASSIGFLKSSKYGIAVLKNCLVFVLWRLNLIRPKILDNSSKFRLKIGQMIQEHT